MIFLGVDGGGTATAYCLISDAGDVLARQTDAPSIYPLPAGPERVATLLREGVAGVCASAGVTAAEVDHAFVGIPTYGEVSSMRDALDAAPRAALGHDRYDCDNDVVCGWAGSLAGRDGIHVVSGTGSIVYGQRRGAHVRTGGWGHVFGDEGSAYWIAVHGLNACARMSDGRMVRGPLLGRVLDHLGITAELDLVAVVHERWGGDRAQIAGLCRLIAAAAQDGDEAARAVFDGAGGERAGLVVAARRGLHDAAAGDEAEVVEVSYSGGVFATGEIILAPLRAGLSRGPGSFALRPPRLAPVLGAAVYAARRHGTPLTDAALARLAS